LPRGFPALAAFPNINRTFYVDQAAGNDANDGSEANPFLTLQKTVNMTPIGGLLTVYFLTDYHVSKRVDFKQQSVAFNAQVAGGGLAKVTFAGTSDGDATSTADFSSLHSNCYFECQDIQFEAVTAGAGVTDKGMFRSRGNMTLRLSNCQIDLPVGSDQCVINNDVFCALSVSNLNGGTGPVAGRWIQDVAAATDPASIRTLIATNLTSL